MLGRGTESSWETCFCEGKASTGGTTLETREASTAEVGVRVLRSSDEASVMGVEQRQGSCANASEVERERIDGLKRKITLASQLTWEESSELMEHQRKYHWKQEALITQKAQPMTKVRKLQRALYWQAKSKPKWKAWTLYGDLCSREILEEALRRVIANKGGPGVDGVRVETLRNNPELKKQFLEQLREELRNKTYKPQPIRRVNIPKRDGKTRPLGIPIVTS